MGRDLKEFLKLAIEESLMRKEREVTPGPSKGLQDASEEKRFGSILNMTLSEFEKANMAIRMRSELLKEDIYLASNEGTKEKLRNKGLVVYLPSELRVIIRGGIKGNDLRKAHLAKKLFGGRLSSDMET